MSRLGVKKIGLYLLFSLLSCFLLVGCGSNGNNKNNLTINISGFTLEYIGNQKLSRVALKTDDLDEIVDLYQEEGEDVGYRDSLLIAKRYSQGLGINTFVQENLNVLEDHGLILSNLNKKQISFQIDGKKVNGVLVEYEITEGFIEEIPMLYISQLFIPDGNVVLLMSFITENSSSRNNMSKAFKQLK